MPFSGSSPIESSRISGLGSSSSSPAKIEPISANWSRCSGRASAFAPASSRSDGPFAVGITTAIAGRWTPGTRRRWIRPAASIAPVLPAETTASALAVGDRPTRRDERRVRLRPHRLGRLLVHLDHVGRLDELEPAGLEPGRSEEDRRQAVGRGEQRAGDDLVRRAIAAHGVDRNAGQGYGAGVRSGSISRPLYVLHVGHT